MASRSAGARQKRHQLVEKRVIQELRHYPHEPEDDDPDEDMSVPSRVVPFPESSVQQIPKAPPPQYPPSIRRRSRSSTREYHREYPFIGPPGAPILEGPSQIEKSEFRAHMDGISTSMRRGIGRLLKANTEDIRPTGTARPGTATQSSNSGSRHHSFGISPSTALSTASSDFIYTEHSSQQHHGLKSPHGSKISWKNAIRFVPHMGSVRSPERGYECESVRGTLRRPSVQRQLLI